MNHLPLLRNLMRYAAVCLLVVAFGATDAWAQEGFWYIDYGSSYYLVPADDPQQANKNDAYYSADYSLANGDPEKPFLTTYKTGQDNNSKWIITASGESGYYNIQHYLTGKYVVYEPPYSSATNRKSVHLLDTDSPGENAKFAITASGSGYNIRPKSVTSGNKFLNVAAGNKDSYYGQGDTTTPPCYYGIVGLYSSGVWNFTAVPACVSPTISYAEATGTVSLSTSTDGATIYYTTDGTNPTESSTAYTVPFIVNNNAVVKAIAVKDGLANSLVTSKQLVKYTYNIVNSSGKIAVQYTTTLPQAVGTPLSGYSSIPFDIRSSYISDETVTFYTFSGSYAVGDDVTSAISTADPITATTASNNIYITYTTSRLSAKFLHLQGARPMNIRQAGSPNSYFYDNSGTLAYDASAAEFITTSTRLWYIKGTTKPDPYEVTVQNAAKTLYLTTTPSLSAEANTYFLYSNTSVDANHEDITLKNLSDGTTLSVRVNPVELPTSYYLIDKSGKILFGPKESNSSSLAVPSEWQSPLVSQYHYWKIDAFDATKRELANPVYDLIPNPSAYVISSLTDLEDGEDIYITYDVDPSFEFDTTDNDTVGTQAYMLRFTDGETFYQENGGDALMATAQKAVYPYSNGDAMLYVYGSEQWDAQLSSGASTRTRWLWYVVSPNSDPYHVYIMSHQGQATSHNYFRTYPVTYGGSTHIVTSVTTKHYSAVVAGETPTEYMILKQGANCKLVTVDPLSDGSSSERRTVNTFEQYWKNNPTVQDLLRDDKVTQTERFSDNIQLDATQKGHLPSSWHSYKAFANAAPWVEWRADSTGTGRKYIDKDHWFQTIDMGSSGEFLFEPVALLPQVILIDNHGWEVMRMPMYTELTAKKAVKNPALSKYDSPMVEQYHWYPTASKVPGYHKYNVSDQQIVVYNASRKATSDRYEHNSTTLTDDPYTHIDALYQAQDYRVKTDFYVTYTVKPEYAGRYAGAATAAGTQASKYLVKQGDSYAKISSSNTLTTGSAPTDLENVPDDILWYVKPNFNIDAEMGYNYEGEYAEKDKADTEVDNFNDGKNGFDPYNVQIQSVANTDRYFKTTATASPTLTGGAWQGSTNGLSLQLPTYNTQTADGYDKTTLTVTNTTFMVVNDGSGNMRLMPRFDNTKVVDALTGGDQLKTPATAENHLTLELVPTYVSSSSQIKAMGGQFILQDGFTIDSSVGSFENPFRGTIDGKLHTISSSSTALVNYADNAIIKNVIIDNVTIATGDTVGAICNVAKGKTRIYNCGVLASGSTVRRNAQGYDEITTCSSTISGSAFAGGIVGFLDDYARVINCFSYANITGGTEVGGIVGHNDYQSTSANIRTMVMNCMFYGDITGGTSKAPVYNGFIITNVDNNKGMSNFNFFRAEASYAQNRLINNANCALMAETRFLQRFEFFRHLLNSNRELAAWWATGDIANKDQMMKWELEPSQIGTATPYPVLKPVYDDEGHVVKYPSVVNIDAASAEEGQPRNQGGKLGTLTVNIEMGSGGAQFGAPTGASITTSSLTLNITDKDTLRHNYNYYKVQLPYYNEVGSGNCTGNRVVTGWKITDITGGTAGSFTTGEDAPAYNFADRNCTNKDKYSESGRIFNQGAYFDVPEGVTAITIQPYWAKAAYLADAYPDVVYNQSMSTAYNVANVGGGQRYSNGSSYSIKGENQTVYTTMADAIGTSALNPNGSHTPYDYAVVLVGNYHQYNGISGDNKPYTVMSIDRDDDNEPDYSFMLRFDSRTPFHPVRYDFLNLIGLGMAQKSTGGPGSYNFGIMQPRYWFEVTNTALFRVTQFEYDTNGRKSAPYILHGGVIEQWVSGQANGVNNQTKYFHVGGNVWFKEFHLGVHQDKTNATKHPPISVTGGDFEQFYLTGLYRADVSISNDNAECYINGGRFGTMAGTGMEGLGTGSDKGNITWQIDHADIDEFYGGGINAAHPAIGNISTTISNSHVTQFCGGPKFGDMSAGKTVTTTATGCTFGTYFGAGYGGNSYSRQAPTNQNDKTNIDWNKWLKDNYKQDYNAEFGGVSTQYSYQFIPMSGNVTNVARIFVEYVKFSLATCHTVKSSLTGCTVTGNFYGGGSLGKVDGTVTSTLNNCTMQGNVFGAGYSASLPTVAVDSIGFRTEPYYYTDFGTYRTGVKGATTTYTWEQRGTVSSTATAINTTDHILYTTEDLTTLGTVAKDTLTLQGTTSVAGSVFGGGDQSAVGDGGAVVIIQGNTTVAENVFGGGNRGAVSGSTQVIDEAVTANSTIIGSVYGGGNEGNVNTNTEVHVKSGTVTTDVYGGGKGAETVVNGSVTVNIGAKSGEGILSGTGSIGGDVYGGSALGTVHATAVNVYGGVVSGSVFGGGLGQVEVVEPATPAIAAQNLENAVVTVEGGTVSTAVYGGSNANGVLKKDAMVTIIGGTVGTAPGEGDPITNVVFGGGFGAPTLVEGNVTVNIGTKVGAVYTGTATINGHVYGGGALGNTNASGPSTFNTDKFTTVNLFADTIHGDVYGGALGNAETAAYVGGDVRVTLDGTKIPGSIFGCNNVNGTPKGHVRVHVLRTVDSRKDDAVARESRTTYDVTAVYGGGNQADYIPADALLDPAVEGNKVKVDSARTEVIIEGCDTTSINHVYGGGNAAAVPATDVTVKGTYIINTLYGGGNGSGVGNPGANVGIYKLSGTPTNYGTGKAVTKLLGGYINNVYGGSNTKGDVRGGTDVRTKGKNEVVTGDKCDDLKVGNIYGAGSHADVNNDVTIILECMPEDYVDQVFGGAEQATVNGNVTLRVTSGKFGRVFGGNNAGGDIRGSITVNVDEDGCQPLKIGEVYGGGNAAPYSVFGCTKAGEPATWTANESGDSCFNEVVAGRAAIQVNVHACTSVGKVFGGGRGATARVVGNTHVYVNPMVGIVNEVKRDTIGKIGQVFGGGSAADLKGNTRIDIGTALASENNGAKILSGTDYLHPTINKDTTLTAGVYGGGYSADVDGNTELNIGTMDLPLGTIIGGNVFGGGFGETTHVTGNVVVNIGTKSAGTPVGYARITGDVYGGSAKGKVNSHLVSSVETYTAGKTTQVNLYGGTISGNLYGGGLGEATHAADVYGPVTVNVEGGKVTNVFGCNNVLGSPKSTATVNIHGMTAPVEPATYTITSVYGGGNQAAYNGTGGVSVAMTNGWVNDVFGGGLGSTATVGGSTTVTLSGGSVINDVYGGGSQGNVTGAVTVALNGGTVGRDVYGGGALAQTNTEYHADDHPTYVTNVTLAGATVTRNLYGGGLGDLSSLGEGHSDVAADVDGPVKVVVTSGSVFNVFGCNNTNGMPKSTVAVEIGTKTGTETPYTYGGTGTISGSVYGGGNLAAYTGSPAVKLYKGTVNTNVYGGGLGSTAIVTGSTSITMEGGTVNNDVYGGGSQADVTGNVSVVVAGGTIINNVYGGGALANTNTENWNEANLVTTYEKITATLTTGVSIVAGLYKKVDANYILQGANATAEAGAEYYRRFDTAWAAGKTSASNTTTVTLTGGTIGNVFGGGLGNAETPVYVYGDVTVHLNNATERTTYGGTGASFTREVAQNIVVGGTNYPTIPITGKIFGANNFNGSPKGNVTVEIWATKRVDGKAHVLGDYEVHGVYGGGNLADYMPATGKETKVFVHGCSDTSIEYVYGGGNSASVPSTDVIIYGSFDIGYAFGGGNGSKPVKNSAGTWVANGGAMVTGNAKISARGGRIGQVFGGSDAKGDILGSTTADIKTTDDQECILTLTRLFGAGNEADVAGDVNMILSGCSSDNVQYVHGGSYNAHITGDVNLTITSGFYTNVFGGNDARGSIGGHINVNIEETDECKPIVIHNLVGAGNEAPYPGKKKDDSEYSDPGKVTVNIKSATRIDKVYGGGYKADVKGDTEVNINMMKGSKAGTVLVRPDTYTGEVIPNVHVTDGKTYINDAIGTIGDVYGGGNEGNVIGSSTVNIGTASTIQILKRDRPYGAFVNERGDSVYNFKGNLMYDDVDDKKVARTVAYVDAYARGAHITGDVFGGGNAAYVTGNSAVNISTVDLSALEDVKIDGGSVYGGGSRGDVHGNTTVTMAGGYVYDGVYGGGLMGSVGTYTRTTSVTTKSNGIDHSSHADCIGKPTTCTSGGNCTVVVSGGQVGPIEVATKGMKNVGGDGPVDVGFVFGAGRGEVEDPAVDKDADFHTYVNNTDVTISGTALIMASVYGGGENGRVLHDTHVKIQGGQIGSGDTETKGGKTVPKVYTDAEWTGEDPSDFKECLSWDYTSPYLPYDPYAAAGDTEDGIVGTDGHTYYGSVFGGGSGYFPYKKADGTHEWLRSAGEVYGNTVIDITGGHILTSVYGGNETTDVGTYTNNDNGYPIRWQSGGKCTINMVGGTIGVPRTTDRIVAHPVTCYLFGAGKGDQRTHFNTWTNVQETEVNVSGTARIFGSVFGGGEDGHVLGNTKVNIGKTVKIDLNGDGDTDDSGETFTPQSSLKIGTTGTSYVDGNIFGGGRGYSGMALTAGSVGGNVDIKIADGTMLGSVYGGGRLASVGIGFLPADDPSYGQLNDDTGENTYGHITVDISGGTIGTTTASDGTHPVGGNVFGGSMGRIRLLDGTLNPLWPKMAVAKLTSVTVRGSADIKNSVYGGSEYGIVRNRATVNINGGTIGGNVFGGGYGSDDETKTTMKVGGYANLYYSFTPMLWTGCVSGSTFVNITGGTVKKNVYGGGDMASVGLIDFVSDKAGKFLNIFKHESLTDGFGLSWPYKFTYHAAAPNDLPAVGGGEVGGKATVNITGTATITGYVFGASKGKVSFGATDNITEQRYTEAHIANVRETEVTIGTSGGSATTPTIGKSVYGGGEDGHVYEDAKVTIHHGTITNSVFGGGKGEGTFTTTLLDPTAGSNQGKPKASTESVRSWTAGKVYGNTSVTMNDGKVGWYIYGGGNMGSVGKGNYSGGADDYSTAGYGETLSGNLWTSASEGDDAWQFLNSGQTTVTILNGQVGPDSGVETDADGIPHGSVFGGSRGKAAMDVGALSPRYQYAPDFYIGYVNKAVINIGGTPASGATEGTGPTIKGSVYGGGQDGHVRNSTEVNIFKGSLTGMGDAAGRSGHVFGAGSGIGKYTAADGETQYCNNSSGSVTCTTNINIKGGSIIGSVYGGGALASVGPPQTGQGFNEYNNTTTNYTTGDRAHGSLSYNKVTIDGGTISGSVYGASRGPAASFIASAFSGGVSYKSTAANVYNPTKYATSLWTEVNIKPNATPANSPTIGGSVYGGGEMGRVKESTVVNLTGGSIAHDVFGGGKGTRGTDDSGTNAIAAEVGGNTTVELNKGVADNAKGCSLERIFGCNDLNGTPRGHVKVHVHATQNTATADISHKVAPTPYSPKRNTSTTPEEGYKAWLNRLIGVAKPEGTVLTGIDASVISAAETVLSGLSAVEEASLSKDQQKSISDEALKVIKEIEKLHDYDMMAVYGGGNLAQYKPYGPAKNGTEADYKATTENTEVIIEGCDVTSIKQVYGGGNAAPVPATNVSVSSVFVIDELFGGGNGLDNYQIGNKWYQNPGANVGYNDLEEHVTDGSKGDGVSEATKYQTVAKDNTSSKEDRITYYAYGTGRAETAVTGGHIHTVYGGSNQKGNIREVALSQYQKSGTCPLITDETYGGSKTAEMDGEIIVVMDCVEDGGTYFGGSQNADVNNNVTINITNGSYDKVYGGNNKAGTINGAITINIEEKGCTPIIIGELYGGGFYAPYSVYGYKKKGDGTYETKTETDPTDGSKTIESRIPLASGDAGALATPHRDPYINIISATSIGTIYGGGDQAKVVGSPHINVNMEQGKILADYANDDSGNSRTAFTQGDHTTYYVDSHEKDGDAILRVGTIGAIYGGGNLADVVGNTYVDIGTGSWYNYKTGETEALTRHAAKITGNVYGGGKGTADTFTCEKAMIGVNDEGEDPAKREGGTSVVIANGTVGGNVYGGGEVGRVEKNTVVTIGNETVTDTVVISGNVFAAGKGVETHGYSALVRGNSSVTVQGNSKVLGSVYGGGEKSSVGRYNVRLPGDTEHTEVEVGMPYGIRGGGTNTVIIRGNAEIGPDNMVMHNKLTGKPDDRGHVFGAGQGVLAYETETPGRYYMDGETYTWESYSDPSKEADYLKYTKTLGLSNETEVTIEGNAFVKGSVYGGSENGHVRENTHVTIQGNCQIGSGYMQMTDDGTYLDSLATPVTPVHVNRRYTDAEWSAGHLIATESDPAALRTLAATYYKSSLPECASWHYGFDSDNSGKNDKFAGYDRFALTTAGHEEEYEGGATTDGGRRIGSDGHTFFGNVFGGGSGYYPYKPGKWNFDAGSVGGKCVLEIKGGHILTNAYGGSEFADVAGSSIVIMTGGTIGVPRTLGQIVNHPVTCYLFGAGKGDQRLFFNKNTNVHDVKLSVSGDTIYGSVFGGGEDGHVLGNVTMDIEPGAWIGTWGTSYVDGNVFGGGRGFSGEALTAGNVAGTVTLNVKGGTMLGSVYGGGRLASVGYGLFLAEGEELEHYGEMIADGKKQQFNSDGTTNIVDAVGVTHGHVNINISGGTIGNDHEYRYLTAETHTDEGLATLRATNHVPQTGYLYEPDTKSYRLVHTRGGNVFTGGMGRFYHLNDSVIANWQQLGNVKSTKLTISGGTIKSNVYGGSEMGWVQGTHRNAEDTNDVGTEIVITGGTIGTEIKNGSGVTQYTFGSVYGGGRGDATEKLTYTTDGIHPIETNPKFLAGRVKHSTQVKMEDGTVKASVYGGGEVGNVGMGTSYGEDGSGNASVSSVVTVSGGTIGIDSIHVSTVGGDSAVYFGGQTMGNVYGGCSGDRTIVRCGTVFGNTVVNISQAEGKTTRIYHNVYGGGAFGSVGDFEYEKRYDELFGTTKVFGVDHLATAGTGTATVNITGGTIGVDGHENGMIFGSSRGEVFENYQRDDYMAWVYDANVNIGTVGQGIDAPQPQIRGSVYGSGENGHTFRNTTLNIHSGKIGNELEYYRYRGNVYGGGCGTDYYLRNGVEVYKPFAGVVRGNTNINIDGGLITGNVYGAGAMASVGTVNNDTTLAANKHSAEASSFALSWPYKFEFADNTGTATINITGGHIGIQGTDGGDVYGSARGKAGKRYEMAHHAYVRNTVVNINLPTTAAPSDMATLTTSCITGSVHGSGEDGYVYDSTRVTLNAGLIGHSLYGAGKGLGTYKMSLPVLAGKDKGDLKERDIYGLLPGKVFGNTYVTINGGHVVRNVYGGGNMASVGKGNYTGGADDYSTEGYGETITTNLWDGVSDDSKAFLSSGKTTVKVLGGTVGYIDPADPAKIKNGLPYGNVFGGSTGEAAPNIFETPRYYYCPAFFSGYVNQTDVTIGGYRCTAACKDKSNNDHAVGETMTDQELEAAFTAEVIASSWTRLSPTILASVYGGGQDGHVRRDTKVTVNSGEIGKAYNETNQTLLQTTDLDSPQWLFRGNVFGGGSGINKYKFDFDGDGLYTSTVKYGRTAETEVDTKEEDYSTLAGSVTRFSDVVVRGGTIHRNVYGGGSLGSVGAPKITQDYLPNKKGDTSGGLGEGKQSQCTVTIGGEGAVTIGTPDEYAVHYGGEVYGASRGQTDAGSGFGSVIWTRVNILEGARIQGNVYGGGDSGEVKRDTDVRIGRAAE